MHTGLLKVICKHSPQHYPWMLSFTSQSVRSTGQEHLVIVVTHLLPGEVLLVQHRLLVDLQRHDAFSQVSDATGAVLQATTWAQCCGEGHASLRAAASWHTWIAAVQLTCSQGHPTPVPVALSCTVL